MTKDFWEYFSHRSLVLYCQLQSHFQHHGFMIVLTLLGDELQVKSQKCCRDYICEFKNCCVDPSLPCHTFIRNMKVCHSVYGSESPVNFRLESYLCDVIRELTNYSLEKDSYKPRM